MPAAVSANPRTSGVSTVLRAADYDLDATLDSGQAFRWRRAGEAWEGIVGGHWFRLRQVGTRLEAETATPLPASDTLTQYLGLNDDLTAIIARFPPDPPLRSAVATCRGLRLLRQDPWECLASFVLSSTKQIVQIRQIVETLCDRYGEPVCVPGPGAIGRSFPSAARLARCTELELRDCRMGFRARYLRAVAMRVAAGDPCLTALPGMPLEEARAALVSLPGVGRKIADCVLLFSLGFRRAFPVDVWVMRALQDLYFGGRTIAQRRLLEFTDSHFGPEAGYAQQYLFHHIRMEAGRVPRSVRR